MLCIKKVLNSSVVLVSDDEKNEEFIVLEKGIGFGRKQGQEVQLTGESKVFVLQSEKEYNQLTELLAEIPAIYLEITQDIVEYAHQQLQTSLNEHIYLALTDHLHFAVERYRQNMVITNRVFWEMKSFYPKEFGIGLWALERLRELHGVELPEEEAANIAFHIINAQQEDGVQYNAMRAVKLIGRVVTMVTYSMQCQPDKESIHYSRFISHMQYFAERFFSNKLLNSENDFLYEQIQQAYPKAFSCALKVRQQILKEYGKNISNEEVAYLSIHIHRLITGQN